MSIKEKLAAYKNGIVGNAIYDVIKYVIRGILGIIILAAGGNFVADFSHLSIAPAYKVVLFIIILLAISLIVLEILAKKYSKGSTALTVENDYRVIKREVFFTYGRDLSRYELLLNIKSNIKGLNRIHGKYTWSGSEKAIFRCETKHCTLIPLTRKDSYIEYEIELRKNYNKGQITSCKIVGDMPDSQHTFVPFLSTQITEETDELIMNICIPPEYNIKEVICEELAIVRNSNQEADVVSLDENGRYTWRIKNPKLFFKYSIRWEL